MRFGSRTSLEARLCILTIGTLFVVLLGVGHFAVNEQVTTLVRDRYDGFDAITRALALTAEPLIAEKDSHVAEQVSQQLKNTSWDLRYVVITDEKGRAIYAGSNKVPPTKQTIGNSSWKAVRSALGYGGIDGTKLHKVSVPVRLADNRWGSFVAGYSMSRTQAEIDEMQSRILLAFVIALIVGIVCSIAFARSVAALLRSIIRGARAVAGGNLTYRVPMTKVADELSHLVEAFNYMVDTLNRTQEHLVDKANGDTLTGLNNHRYFQERLEAEMGRSLRYSHRLALLMINIDRFKEYNQKHGHGAGDNVLSDIGTIITETFRDTDICARYGGDVFTALLPETELKDAQAVAERLRQAVCRHQFPMQESSEQLTVSIGVATAPNGASEVQDLLVAAEVAMHRAKAEGGNRVMDYKSDEPSYPAADPYHIYALLHTDDLDTMVGLAQIIDEKHKLPAGHSRAVADTAAKLAKKMGLTDDEIAATFVAGLLRDVGKIAIPDELIGKDKALTDEEKRIVSSHPKLGFSIMEKSRHLKGVLPGVLHHHERFDGTGYPDKVDGTNIPMMARVLSVADAYHSMLSSRPHRKKLTPEEAQMEIAKGSGTQFDPSVVQAFLGLVSEEKDEQKAA